MLSPCSSTGKFLPLLVDEEHEAPEGRFSGAQHLALARWRISPVYFSALPITVLITNLMQN